MATSKGSIRGFIKELGYRVGIAFEKRWDAYRAKNHADERPEHFRIVTYLGHGNGDRVVVRGRVLDDPKPSDAIEGENIGSAIRRNLARFSTDELPDVPLRIRIGDTEVETTTDDEGYFDVQFETDLDPSTGLWTEGVVELAGSYRGLTDPHTTPIRVRVPGDDAAFGVISDIDDTILQSKATSTLEMMRRTVGGSAVTRSPLAGAPELYRALARGPSGHDDSPFFYVSSSPWNLYGFLNSFLNYRGFPPGPILLRDFLGDDPKRGHSKSKHKKIAEVLDLHPDLQFVLIGDSGQEDPEIYREVVRRYPGRILAVYIRDVNSGSSGKQREIVTEEEKDVPIVLAPDSTAIAKHAATLGLIDENDTHVVEQAVSAQE